jgi:flagellar assembly protein FliH
MQCGVLRDASRGVAERRRREERLALGAPDNKVFGRLIPKEQQGDAASWRLQPLDGAPAANPLTARDRGAFERGLEQGRREGMAAAAARQQSQAQSIARVLDELRARFATLESQCADAMLDLALEVARQVVRHEVRVDRKAVLPVLREAVALVIDQQAHPRVHLNPRDFEAIRGELEADGLFRGCRFIPDAQVGHGGCRVETALGEVDGRLATRWRRVVTDALGIDDTWLDEPAADGGAGP